VSSYLESFRKERGYMMESDRLSVRKSTMEDHIRALLPMWRRKTWSQMTYSA